MMTKTTEGYRDMARPKKNTAPETTQATKTDTVMVALNRTTGITFPMPDGRKVLIEGNAYPSVQIMQTAGLEGMKRRWFGALKG